MTRTVHIAETAKLDLQNIRDFVADYDAGAADKLVRELIKKFALLRDFPHIGREQNRLLVNLRSFVVKDYLIFYQPLNDGIEILRVMHGAQDIEDVFKRFLDAL